MFKTKIIRNVATAFVIVFMSMVLCGAGCNNAADSDSGEAGSFLTSHQMYSCVVDKSTGKAANDPGYPIQPMTFRSGKIMAQGIDFASYTTSGNKVTVTFPFTPPLTSDLTTCPGLTGDINPHNSSGCKYLKFVTPTTGPGAADIHFHSNSVTPK